MCILYIWRHFFHHHSTSQHYAGAFPSTQAQFRSCFTGAHFTSFDLYSHRICALCANICFAAHIGVLYYTLHKTIQNKRISNFSSGYPLLSFLLNSTMFYFFRAMPRCSLSLCRLLKSELIAEVRLLLYLISFYIIYKQLTRNHAKLSRIKLQ